MINSVAIIRNFFQTIILHLHQLIMNATIYLLLYIIYCNLDYQNIITGLKSRSLQQTTHTFDETN